MRKLEPLWRNGGLWDNPVDHGRWTGAGLHKPVCKIGRMCGEIFPHQLVEHAAIAGEIVAAEQGQPARTRCLAPAHAFGKQRIEAARACPRLIECAIARAAIALLGHGEADDPRCRIGDGCDHGGGMLSSDQDVADREAQPVVRALTRSFGDQVKPVLRVELLGHPCRTQRNAGDHPPFIARRHRRIGVGRLVRAGECAEPEMHDPVRLCFAVLCQKALTFQGGTSDKA